MSRKALFIVAVAAVVAVGMLFFRDNPSVGEPKIKNSEMLAKKGAYAITTSEVEYFAGAKGYLVRPEQPGKYPGVVMIHENRGLRPEIRDTAETLAKEGYIVLALE